MIKYIEGQNIFNSKAEALVNPVNCSGIMGKGLALEFKKSFPEILTPYKQACKNSRLQPGILVLVHLLIQPDLFNFNRHKIVLFPTKKHWKGKSQIAWIEMGLIYLVEHYAEWNLKSIAMPKIGCGLGGLSWNEVKPLIEKYLEKELLEVEVYI